MTLRLTKKRRPESVSSVSQYSLAIAAVITALGAAALINRSLAKKAQRENPPTGKFVTVEGVRLHYVERGSGQAIVLLHGNGTMISDFASSGLIEMASQNHRVIAFDRPGFGYSARPRDTIWTPETQARLIYRALDQIGIDRAKVLGHSWGTLVAAALALQHPELVSGLILVSGYFYPKPRADVLLLSGPAVPGAGDLMSQTISPILGRILWPAIMRKIFGPASIPTKFRSFPKEMALRPSQLQASAAETAMMIPSAVAMQGKYQSLRMPVIIVAGEQDRLVDFAAQSGRLHGEVQHSKLRGIVNAGHMVHHTATALVMKAIDEVGQTGERNPSFSREAG